MAQDSPFRDFIKGLNREAAFGVPPVQSTLPLRGYFDKARSFLVNTGRFKKAGDLRNAYVNLRIMVNERLPKHPRINDDPYRGEFEFNRQKALQVASSLKSLGEGLREQFSAGGHRLPPPPRGVLSEQVVETVAMNRGVQSAVGMGVARVAENEEVQRRVADGVAGLARNEDYQQKFGESIAANSDSALVQGLARSRGVQRAAGVAVAQTVGSRQFQRSAGRAVARAASDPEVQRRMARGAASAAKGGWNLGGILARAVWKKPPQQ